MLCILKSTTVNDGDAVSYCLHLIDDIPRESFGKGSAVDGVAQQRVSYHPSKSNR